VSHLVGLVLEALDLVDDGAPAALVGPEELLLQLGGLDGELGHGAEEIEEFLVAGQQAHDESM
jgi:hypothetical protein